MSRSRILSSIAAASLGALLLGACSTEALTERAASFGLEQAIEGDQDIDFDFGGDGSGGFSISTEEGDFSLNFDEENGGIAFNTDEGDGVISFDESGIVFNTDDGDGVITFDEENGSINFDTDGGDGTVNFDDNGNVSINTDEGEFGIFNSSDVPENWPSAIGFPATLVPGGANFSSFELGPEASITTGIFSHSPNEPYAAAAISSLENAGWQVSVSNDDGSTVFAQLQDGNGTIAQIVSDEAGSTSVTVTQGY